jgi:hypothetical protein
MIQKRLQIALLLYVIVIGAIIFINPKFMYDKEGKIKIFGLGDNKTLFPLWLVIFVIAVLCYYIAEILVNM